MLLYNYSKFEILKEVRTMQTIVIAVETKNCIASPSRIQIDCNVN